MLIVDLKNSPIVVNHVKYFFPFFTLADFVAAYLSSCDIKRKLSIKKKKKNPTSW